MANAEIDIITYFDAKFSALKEYFDERFKSNDARFYSEREATKEEIVGIHSQLKEHGMRIEKIEQVEGNKARNLVQAIKDNILRFVIPTLIVVIVFLMGSGKLAALIGINQ